MSVTAPVTLSAAALALYDADLCVVPAAPDGTKRPAVEWKPFQKQRPDRAQVQAWFADGGTVYDGVGIITGWVSGNCEMFEIEGVAQNEGVTSAFTDLAEHTGLHGLWERISKGYLEITPRGGIHVLYYVLGPVAGNTKLARRPATDEELAAAPGDRIKVLLETRGEGGFTVCAPSGGRTHPNGHSWILVQGGPTTIATITPEERDSLHQLARAFDRMPEPEPDTTLPRQRSTAREDGLLRPGDDYNARATWAELIGERGWKAVYILGGVTYWRRPGKTAGISASTGRNDADNLYVFSTSTEFEAEKPYSKFGAYCVAPETKVLRSDLTWARAGDLVAGDALVGVDEEISQKAGRRKLRLSHVEAAERRILPCYRITLADGRQIVCTDQHPWLACSAGKGGNMRWIQTQNLRPGQRICAITNGTWDRATDYDSGWLAGLFDGEGWVDRTKVAVAQKEGPIMDRARRLLTERGFAFKDRQRPDVANLTLNDLPSILRLLGSLQPTRLVNKMPWIGRGAWTQAAPNAVVVSIEFLGPREVAAFTTTTRTFIAEGLVSHNTFLVHNGNWAAAAKDLAGQGYGDPLPEPTIKAFTPSAADGEPAGESASEPAPSAETLAQSDDGSAIALANASGDVIRYCSDRGRWLAWDGARWQWQPRGGGDVREYHKAIARALPYGGSEAKTHKRRALSSAGTAAALAQAETARGIAIGIAALDARPWELNTPAGIIDLRTGTLLAADPAKLHTRMTAAAPADAPAMTAWDAFLNTTFGGDAELIAYLRRLAGYSAIGSVGPHVLPFCHGSGGNGKGVFLETIAAVLGDYATTAPVGFLMASAHTAHETEIARLAGARMVICSEVNEDDRFDEAKVKQLTGGDSITARFMRADHFTFTPSHQLWLAGNSKPAVRTGGRAFWRRLRLIGFEYEIPDAEMVDDLQGKLTAEHGPSILRWIIDGAREYYENGLSDPASVKSATDEYARDQDTVSQFLDDCARIGGDEAVQTRVRDVRAAYEAWCASEGSAPVTARAFTQALARAGIGSVRSHGVRFYAGITIIDSPAGSAGRGWEAEK